MSSKSPGGAASTSTSAWTLSKLLLSPQFLIFVGGIIFTAWIYRASPKNIRTMKTFIDTGILPKIRKINREFNPPRAGPKKRSFGPRRPGIGKYNRHEEECRRIFQKIFRKSFVSIRPRFLSNPATGEPLEFDGWCPSQITPIGTGLAFEYDGRQHREYVPFFHRNDPNRFEYQKATDAWKNRVCWEKKIMLIRIPDYIPYDSLEKFIRSELHKKGFRFSSGG
jgi:hypothetical protein